MADGQKDEEQTKLEQIKRSAKPTMREKTTQAATDTDTPSRKHRFFHALFKPLRPVGRVLARIERFKPVHILGLIIVPRYFRNSWNELRQVTWPNGRESRRLTSAVLLFAVVFGILIAVADYGLDKVFKKVILKS